MKRVRKTIKLTDDLYQIFVDKHLNGKNVKGLVKEMNLNYREVYNRLQKDGYYQGVKTACGSTHNEWNGYEEIGMWFFGYMRAGAKKRNLPFEITIQDIWNQWVKQGGKCALTGRQLILSHDTIRMKDRTEKCTASLDRKDNKRGYLIDNIQFVHKTVNMMRKNYSIEEFRELCTLVADRADAGLIKLPDGTIVGLPEKSPGV